MKVKKAEDLFINVIKSLYSAESQLEKALPKMAKQANDEDLIKGMEAHLKTTQKQKERLEKISEMMEFSPRGKKCIAMEGLINEMEADMKEIGPENLYDPELIMAAQKVEHYEIAVYGSAVALAELMGNNKVVKLLQETLEEEKEQDKLLTKLAVESVNEKAMNGEV
jgi:ferritin-like metal-binding protein YciE